MKRTWSEPGQGNQMAFVFSCPGQEEMVQGRPAAGATGRNLDKLIKQLHDWRVPIATRQAATVTNAWPGVEYPRQRVKERTQADKGEILLDWNLDRLAAELAVVHQWVICFGDRAEWAVSELHRQARLRAGCRYAVTSHPSPTNVNRNGQTTSSLILAAAKLAAQMGYGTNVPPEIREILDISPKKRGLQLSAARLLAAETRRLLEKALPGFPNTTKDDGALLASRTLVAALELLNFNAQVVTGTLQLKAGWPVELRRRKGATKTPLHAWVVFDGWVFDLARDRYADCLDKAPPVFCKDCANAREYQVTSAAQSAAATSLPEVVQRVVKNIAPSLRQLGLDELG